MPPGRLDVLTMAPLCMPCHYDEPNAYRDVMRGERATEQLRRGWLEDFPAEECLKLLRSPHVARVVYDDGGPVVVPVNYLVDHGTVLFRTYAHSSLGQR
jgi:hypothetical protein